MYIYEEMSLNAWPSVKSAHYKQCIFRSSYGYTNRANSANPLYIDNRDILAITDYAENFYAEQKYPCIFKILDTTKYEELDRALKEKKYKKISETNVMKYELDKFQTAISDSVIIEEEFSRTWFNAFMELNQMKEEFRETAWNILNLITVKVLVSSIKIDNKIVACGFGAIENKYVGFFDIVVDKERRGQGWGRTLMKGILGEAKRRGVQTGYLQVAINNTTAMKLYKSIGFEPVYKYWYRKK